MDISKVTDGIRKVLPLKYCGAVIVAAGTASRMGGIDKVMAELEGEPMIVRTVRTFQTCEAIREIVIVTREVRKNAPSTTPGRCFSSPRCWWCITIAPGTNGRPTCFTA